MATNTPDDDESSDNKCNYNNGNNSEMSSNDGGGGGDGQQYTENDNNVDIKLNDPDNNDRSIQNQTNIDSNDNMDRKLDDYPNNNVINNHGDINSQIIEGDDVQNSPQNDNNDAATHQLHQEQKNEYFSEYHVRSVEPHLKRIQQEVQHHESFWKKREIKHFHKVKHEKKEARKKGIMFKCSSGLLSLLFIDIMYLFFYSPCTKKKKCTF